MITPNLKGKRVQIFNERETLLSEVRAVDRTASLAALASKALLFLGLVLILLNNMGFIAPGSYFGTFSWVTAVVFLIGLIINFVAIPHLYFSSFQNFKQENAYWDSETFLIVPSFFFGTFFLYGSKIFIALPLLIASVLMIFVVHYKFLRLSWEFLLKSSNEAFLMEREYFLSLKYLTAYYLLLLTLLLLINPLQLMFVWVRMHI
jgi:hypothetical protein